MTIETLKIQGIDIPASRVALGTWAIGGWMWGGADDQQAIATIHEALEKGINIIDTAPVYGFGHSEKVVGKVLKGKRDKVIIATKVALNWKNEQPFRDSSPARIKQEIEDSLRRLQTDYIDLYQVHWPDPKTPIEETARVLEELYQAGKVRALGVSNYSVAEMDRFQTEAPLMTIQPPYNLFEREMEKDILPYAKKHQKIVLAYGALCRGLLSGAMTADREFKGDDLRKSDPKFQPPRFAQYLKATAALSQLAKERYNKTLLAFAIRWLLDKGPIIALWGARKPTQIIDLSDVFGWHISEADMQQVDTILTECITAPPVDPKFMAPPSR